MSLFVKIKIFITEKQHSAIYEYMIDSMTFYAFSLREINNEMKNSKYNIPKILFITFYQYLYKISFI